MKISRKVRKGNRKMRKELLINSLRSLRETFSFKYHTIYILRLLRSYQILLNLLFVAVFLNSCFKDDERVPPYPGEVSTIEQDIETYQVYFDLETNKVVLSHRADAWELGFESDTNGWHVLVNSGAYWFIYDTHQTNVEADINNQSGSRWKYDIQSAYPDSTAVGNWTDNEKEGNVYLLGKYSAGNYLELKWLVFLGVNDSLYKFFYKDENTSESDTVTIYKSDSVNFVYYSFVSKKQINLEPDKSKYDIVFCPYFDLATQFGTTIPYLVRGALINTWQTQAVLDSTSAYNEVDYEKLTHYTFVNQRDVIGYQWKDVSVDASAGSANYAVRTDYIYIIKNVQGGFFKLRFLSFVLNGYSGYPQFEYKKLPPLMEGL